MMKTIIFSLMSVCFIQFPVYGLSKECSDSLLRLINDRQYPVDSSAFKQGQLKTRNSSHYKVTHFDAVPRKEQQCIRFVDKNKSRHSYYGERKQEIKLCIRYLNKKLTYAYKHITNTYPNYCNENHNCKKNGFYKEMEWKRFEFFNGQHCSVHRELKNPPRGVSKKYKGRITYDFRLCKKLQPILCSSQHNEINQCVHLVTDNRNSHSINIREMLQTGKKIPVGINYMNCPKHISSILTQIRKFEHARVKLPRSILFNSNYNQPEMLYPLIENMVKQCKSKMNSNPRLSAQCQKMKSINNIQTLPFIIKKGQKQRNDIQTLPFIIKKGSSSDPFKNNP